MGGAGCKTQNNGRIFLNSSVKMGGDDSRLPGTSWIQNYEKKPRDLLITRYNGYLNYIGTCGGRRGCLLRPSLQRAPDVTLQNH